MHICIHNAKRKIPNFKKEITKYVDDEYDYKNRKIHEYETSVAN